MGNYKFESLTLIAQSINDKYCNVLVRELNDHVIRLSLVTEPFFWHYHPNSDEAFLVLEGVLVVDFRDRSVELAPGQLLIIPKYTEHRTRPLAGRSVNITFESKTISTIKC